jgi:hypothetical protein
MKPDLRLEMITSPGKHLTKTPITVTNLQVVQIIHPNHPLNGKCRPVIRATGVGGGGERCWVIEDGDLGRLAVPQSWTRLVDEPTTKPLVAIGPETPQVDSHSLWALAKLVATLQSSEKEVANASGDGTENDNGGRSMDGANEPTTSKTDRRAGPVAVPIRAGQQTTSPSTRSGTSRTEGEAGGAR